ncbi:hypothetical protein HELRODRAFT_185750 [Helobdella robusta]|uniref:Luciferin 4-monooxygenase n=1 Tax=Helobdella robusta TaxID=6412 RepID=T1FN87_HELRO|nr:hypothetical protein HELRODRAFT_185750 [Helobdella robusta]ESO00560.1 hypothetical protein HELRODRAFT_185750 [Helobdella robusta]
MRSANTFAILKQIGKKCANEKAGYAGLCLPSHSYRVNLFENNNGLRALTFIENCNLANRARLFHTTSSNLVFKSRHPDVQIPNMSIPEFVLDSKFTTKPALIDGVTGRTLNFNQVKDSVWRLASGFSRLGFKKGDVLMIISENSIEFMLVFHAIMWIGGTVTTCNPHYLVPDISKQAVDADVSYIFCSHLYSGKAHEVSEHMHTIKKVITVGQVDGLIPLTILLEDDGSEFPKNVDIDYKTHTALLPYSSGTTGMPKGVMLTHYNEVANAVQSDIPNFLLNRDVEKHLGLLPFYHIFGIIVHCICSMKDGQTTVIIPAFDPKIFLDCIQRYKIGMTHIVPPIVMFLNKHPMVKRFDMSSLKRLVCAAAPLGAESVHEFHEKYPNCVLGQGYGMTETSPVVTMNQIPTCKTKPASSGTAVPNTFLKVVDIYNNELGPGEKGELCIKGPQLMKGYHKNPEATANMIDSEGWLHTGDICTIDEDGHLFVVDRVKELIKYKGLQVPPAELEALLCSHKAVGDAAVVGVPDHEAGELPKAFVALKPGAKVTAEEIHKFVDERVVQYKRLRGGVVFLPQIPRSPAGKILRRELKNL